jgi:hypothetical protein
MSEQEYENLWHYSEQFSRDPLQRSELLTMAYVMGKKKMGDKVTPGMMKSVMHYRSKELKSRSAFDLHEMGKSRLDAWNKPERVSLDRCALKGEEGQTLSEILLFNKTTPLDFCITNDFLESLSVTEAAVLEDLAAGYRHHEICKRQHLTYPQLQSFRTSLQEKAVAYL